MNDLFETKIEQLDVSLFGKIESQTTTEDKQSLLNIQNAMRNLKETYIYLEIGSYLGGSIQPHLLDYKCRKIFSIDSRPRVQPDERWPKGYSSPNNSTEQMFQSLKKVSPDLGKVTAFERDASTVDKKAIHPLPDICFIDGEHTNRKVISDFQFAQSILSSKGLIIFHDEGVVALGIDRIVKSLKKVGKKFKAYYLPTVIFVIDFTDDEITSRLLKKTTLRQWKPQNSWEMVKCRIPKPIKTTIKNFIGF